MGNGEGRTGGITLGALDGDEFCLFVDGGADAVVVKFTAGKQIHLPVANAILCQGAGTGTDADDLLQCVVGQTHGGEQLVAGQQVCAEGNGQGMGAAGDVGAHQGSFCAEGVCVDLFQLVTAFVVVAVSGGGGKAGGADPVFPECGQYLCLVVFRYLVDFVKTLPQPANGGFSVCVNSRGDAHAFI